MANTNIYPYGQGGTSPAEGSSLSSGAKQQIITTLEKVAWVDNQGQSYLDALEDALMEG